VCPEQKEEQHQLGVVVEGLGGKGGPHKTCGPWRRGGGLGGPTPVTLAGVGSGEKATTPHSPMRGRERRWGS